MYFAVLVSAQLTVECDHSEFVKLAQQFRLKGGYLHSYFPSIHIEHRQGQIYKDERGSPMDYHSYLLHK